MEATVLTTLHLQRKSTAKKTARHPKKKVKPIKVRYISNPMKVKTCVSKFRELVQELTGQHAADIPPDQFIYTADDSSPVPGSVSDNPAAEIQEYQEPYDGADHVPDYLEPLDCDLFVPNMSESFSFCFTNGFNVDVLGFNRLN